MNLKISIEDLNLDRLLKVHSKKTPNLQLSKGAQKKEVKTGLIDLDLLGKP